MSLFEDSIDELVTRIQALSLSGVASDTVKKRKLPWDDNMIHKGITVSPGRIMESGIEHDATNERDMIGYECHLTFVRGTGRGFDGRIATILDWTQKMRREFHNKRLTTVSESGTNEVICKVIPGTLEIPQRYLENTDVGRLAVICWFLEKRDN